VKDRELPGVVSVKMYFGKKNCAQFFALQDIYQPYYVPEDVFRTGMLTMFAKG